MDLTNHVAPFEGNKLPQAGYDCFSRSKIVEYSATWNENKSISELFQEIFETFFVA